MVQYERVSPSDTTWLRMDHPTNPMVIVGVLILDHPVDIERLEATMGSRLLKIARLRQRIEEGLTGFWWVDDKNLTASRHIKRIRLPGCGDRTELEHFVADLASQPLDLAHPLWQCHIVEDYEKGAVVVARVHHAVGDGFALISLLLSLTDVSPKTQPFEPIAASHRLDSAEETQRSESFYPFMSLIGEGLGVLSHVSGEVLARAADPQKAIKDGVNVASELANLLLIPSDSPTILKGKPCGEKRVSWTNQRNLAEIKAVSRALGCTVNDMLLCALAGALRCYLLDKGEKVDGLEVRALVPVSLRTAEEANDLGNVFGIVAIELPIGTEKPWPRLYEIHRRMEILKGSYEPAVTLGLIMALGYAPLQLQERFLDLLSSKATAVMTNVPGPQHARYLAGSRVRQVMFWVPQCYDIAMGISILSFDGNVQFGIMTDAAVISDPEKIIDSIDPELEQLIYFALMSPWGRVYSPNAA